MPKARSAKTPGTYEWINASMELPPVGIRPSRAGNNETGAKGKLKCAGCRLSKIKCLYDSSNLDAVCTNCVRRGISCGIKLPGPKTQIDTVAIPSAQARSPDEIKEYVRLFEQFQRLRPDDGPDETAKLIELVEKGTLKEECGSFVVRTSEEDHEMKMSDWEPSSHNTARIQLSKFEDGYFSAVAVGEGDSRSETGRFQSNLPKDGAPASGRVPFLWLQDTMNIVGFSELDNVFGLSAQFNDDHLGTLKYI